MTPREATWREVRPNSYVRDGQGRVWRVTFDRDEGVVVLTGRDGKSGAIPPPPPDRAVTLMEPTEAEAIAAATSILGGEVEAVKEAGSKVFTCRRFPVRQSQPAMSAGAAHLFLFHASWAGDHKSVAQLIESHNLQHKDYDEGNTHLLSDHYLPHVHS